LNWELKTPFASWPIILVESINIAKRYKMSQLTAHIVYATFKALDAEEKEAFVQLLNKEKVLQSKKKPAKKSSYDNLPAKYHPENIEMLVAEIMHS